MRDRCDYRAMTARIIINLARDEGIDSEMAIVLAEKLAIAIQGGNYVGKFHFNHSKETTK